MDHPEITNFRKQFEPNYLQVVDLTEDGGVIKKTFIEGDGPMPNPGQEVKLYFTAKLEAGGQIFDSSDKRNEPLSLNVGAGHHIEGIEIAVMSMKLSEKADIFIKPQYGYGAVGSPPHIPGNAGLHYRLELVQIGERRQTKWSMTEDELISIAQRLKDDGNAKYKDKKLKEAENLYRDGVAHTNNIKKKDEATKKLKITLHQNLALVLNSQGDHRNAIDFCTKILKEEPTADKALHHRHTAYFKLKQYDEAIQDIKAVIKINPQEKKYRTEFETLK